MELNKTKSWGKRSMGWDTAELIDGEKVDLRLVWRFGSRQKSE